MLKTLFQCFPQVRDWNPQDVRAEANTRIQEILVTVGILMFRSLMRVYRLTEAILSSWERLKRTYMSSLMADQLTCNGCPTD